MSTSDIPRTTFKGIDLENARVTLAKEASDKLGYKRLAQAIAVPGALLFQLRELGIYPLITSKAEAYMASKTHTTMYSGTKKILGALAGTIACLGAFVYGIALNTYVHVPLPQGGYQRVAEDWTALHYTYNVVTGAVGAICCVFLLCWVFDDQWGHGERKITLWEKAKLGDYQGNVPEFALSKALSIKRAVPDAEIGVRYLVEKYEHKPVPPRPRPDPFIYARLGDEFYYFDWWNERNYDGETLPY